MLVAAREKIAAAAPARYSKPTPSASRCAMLRSTLSPWLSVSATWRTIGAGLAEMRRVLRPGGMAAILEFSQPPNAVFAALYHFYSRRILPLIGGALSGSRDAYTYLPESVRKFPSAEELAEEMRRAGFAEVRYERFTGGIVALHLGVTPPPLPPALSAASSSSFPNSVLMNSSCRAPALSAIAFHPFCVGTVTRTFTLPLASRTGRITPGITERMAGFAASSSSRIPRTPSMMLCSTLSLSPAVRNRIYSHPSPPRSGTNRHNTATR